MNELNDERVDERGEEWSKMRMYSCIVILSKRVIKFGVRKKEEENKLNLTKFNYV